MTAPFFDGLRVSCTSVGSCGAIGEYIAKPAAKGTFAQQEAFVVTETNGHWGTPQAVQGLAKVSTRGQVNGLRITCSAPGFCEAGGGYVSKITASSGSEHAFRRDPGERRLGQGPDVRHLRPLRGCERGE
jgi:hypothetical protein